jgi:hypothetical protein
MLGNPLETSDDGATQVGFSLIGVSAIGLEPVASSLARKKHRSLEVSQRFREGTWATPHRAAAGFACRS